MSITKKDLDDLQNNIIQAIDDRFRLNNDMLRQEMRAMENRMEQKLDNLDSKINNAKDEILTGVGEMLDGQVIPQIDDHEVRITRLETKTA